MSLDYCYDYAQERECGEEAHHPTQGEHGVVLEQGLAEDAEEGDHPSHEEPGQGVEEDVEDLRYMQGRKLNHHRPSFVFEHDELSEECFISKTSKSELTDLDYFYNGICFKLSNVFVIKAIFDLWCLVIPDFLRMLIRYLKGPSHPPPTL